MPDSVPLLRKRFGAGELRSEACFEHALRARAAVRAALRECFGARGLRRVPFRLCRLGESPFSGRGAVFLSGLSASRACAARKADRDRRESVHIRPVSRLDEMPPDCRTRTACCTAGLTGTGGGTARPGGRKSANRCGSGFRLRTAQCAE